MYMLRWEAEVSTYHVLQHVSQLRQTRRMVIPDLRECFEHHLALLTFLYRIVGNVVWEDRDDELFRELVQILRHEVHGPFIQPVAVLVQDHIIRITMVLLERQVCCIMILNLDDVTGELRPGFVHGNVRAMLRQVR